MKKLLLLSVAVLCMCGCQSETKTTDPFDEGALKIIRSVTIMDSYGSNIEQCKVEFVYNTSNRLSEIIMPEELSPFPSIKYDYFTDSISVDLGQGKSVVNYAKFDKNYNITKTELSMEVMESGSSIVRDYTYNSDEQLTSVRMTSKEWAGDLEDTEYSNADLTWMGKEFTALKVSEVDDNGSSDIVAQMRISYSEESTVNSTNAYLLNFLLLPGVTIEDVSFMFLPGFYFLPISYNLIDEVTMLTYDNGEVETEVNKVKYGYNDEGYITTISFGETTLLIEY